MNDFIDDNSESLAIGMLYSDPTLFDKFGDKINPVLDFALEDTRFLYRMLYDCYISKGKINETAIKVFLDEKDKSYQKQFQEIGGFELLNRLVEVSIDSTSTFDPIYTRLKTYYAMRELEDQGIDVGKYFDAFKDKSPEFLIENYERFLNRVSLNLKGIESAENLGNGMKDFVEEL